MEHRRTSGGVLSGTVLLEYPGFGLIRCRGRGITTQGMQADTVSVKLSVGRSVKAYITLDGGQVVYWAEARVSGVASEGALLRFTAMDSALRRRLVPREDAAVVAAGGASATVNGVFALA